MEMESTVAPVLRLCDVTVRYGDHLVLDVLDFAVAPGEVVAIMGPNGAGKSTLLHVAALLQRLVTGAVWIEGERATPRNTRRLRRRTAMVMQDPLLFAVSVLANVASGLRFRGVRTPEAERRARTWLAQFGVDHLATHNARTLSGGEAQRVSLARAFAVEPALLLLDEPFAALDPATRSSLLPELASRLRDTQTAAVIVTHDAADTRVLADRRLLLTNGRISHCEHADRHAVSERDHQRGMG
jgi:tungstate transport system ATP-binding protein